MTAFSVHRHLSTARFLKNNFSYENKMTATFANERKTHPFLPPSEYKQEKKGKANFSYMYEKILPQEKKIISEVI